jgi:6-pyruvoyltetrahydropterin/6-carboxytetrahydropterin synthase
MVLDFGVMKDLLCTWLEDNWDHKFLMWDQDGSPALFALINKGLMASSGVVMVPFNPTAENIGNHLLHYIGPELLKGTGVTLFSVKVEETRKCSATVNLI